MNWPILSTKLFAPPLRPNGVSRPRLVQRLNESLSPQRGFVRKVTLISAPAGAGKTTLIAEWLAACRQAEATVRVAWFSLDEGDNELARFLVYLVAAMQEAVPDLGEAVLNRLQSAQPPPAEVALTSLVNEISAVPHNLVLILDDYHVIDTKAVDSALSFLVAHLPVQMHLVIASREDPQLPLPRLRARAELTELRAADLRFTSAETAAFLNETMGLNLSTQHVDALAARTEGWIAGLQLAAISMRGQDDTAGFVDAFSGSHRYILDYLLEEVLDNQPKPIQSFLLRTSILERLCADLCDAVCFGAGKTGGPGECKGSSGRETLAYLDQANLFLIPLDDERRWYRYHHLFAELLQQRMQHDLGGKRVAALHRRAGAWHEENGSAEDAIHHVLAGEDFERAARLLELAWRPMDRSRRAAQWLRWAGVLPAEMVRARPVLSAGFGWALLEGGDLDAAETYLDQAEGWLGPAQEAGTAAGAGAEGMIVADEAEFGRLPASLALARAYRAQALGDSAGCVGHARQALALVPERAHIRRGIVGSLLGLAIWSEGELEEAHRTFATALADFEKGGNLLYAITGTYVLAGIRMAQGRLRAAMRTYERAIRLVSGNGKRLVRGTAELHLGLSELLREQGSEEAAAHHRQRAEALGEQGTLPRWPYHWHLAQARIKWSAGDLDAVEALLDEAERHYIPGPVPDLRPIAALKAQVWVAQGRWAEAAEWARERNLAPGDDLSYRQEFAYMTLARVLLGRYRQEQAEWVVQDALALIERLLEAAGAGQRTGSVLESLILKALAHEAQGDLPAALEPLAQALALAEPEGYARIFVDEGEPMTRLLALAAARDIRPGYTGRLLALGRPQQATAAAPPSPAPSPAPSPLPEPLSERELEVLQLVAEGLTNREIGERLFIALNTVKGHNRRIFGKLQVGRRTEAVARARELGLL